MKATRIDKFLVIERDSNDKPVVEEPYPRPKKATPAELHSWRSRYPISFDTDEQAERAFKKVVEIGDYDKAAAWLDKQ